MTIQDLLDKCETAYLIRDFKKIMNISNEILKKDQDNPIAINYKSISYCFLNPPEKALDLLKKANKLHPNNYYHKNIAAMAYYDLGEYEKSLKCCEEGLKIKDFDWLYENRIKALIKLDRVDEALECYENAPFDIEIIDLLIDEGKYSQALRYCLDEFPDNFESFIDKIKERDTREVGEYYISWIYRIKSKSDIRVCPECGGELIPIIWGFPDSELLEKAQREDVFLGGCVLPPNNPNYHCKNCDSEFDLGYEGLRIECDDYNLNQYIEYKIRQLTSKLKIHSKVAIKSPATLKKELKGFDDNEFNEFINHLKDLDFLFEPREGYVKLVGYDDLKCMKEYCDEGKYAAPKWLVYPQLSAWTIGWRMGAGEHYAMNEPYYGKEFKELFPMPEYWKFRVSESPYKPHPILGYFWTENGKPKYPKALKGTEVNDFIKLGDEKEFQSDTFLFKSIEHALLLSKGLHFKKCNRRDDFDTLRNLEFSQEEEEIWDIYRYSVLLNASYFKIMGDEDLKQNLLETGDEALIYISDDEDNLFGRALMELRDEIRRLCKNEDLIDWGYTEYLKYKPWM